MSGALWSELMVTGIMGFSVSGSVGSETLCYCKAGGCIRIRFALSGAHETLLRKKRKPGQFPRVFLSIRGHLYVYVSILLLTHVIGLLALGGLLVLTLSGEWEHDACKQSPSSKTLQSLSVCRFLSIPSQLVFLFLQISCPAPCL